MNKCPFISINELNASKVKNSSFARLLNWIGKSAKTKKQFLSKYSEYSFCCSKERWLRFVRDVCSYNCLVYREEDWSREYDAWKSKNCSYSIHFI